MIANVCTFKNCRYIFHRALLNEPPQTNSYNQDGSFVCFVNPPAENNQSFPRDIIFLLDRSGSMYGKPYRDAALVTFTFKLNLISLS